MSVYFFCSAIWILTSREDFLSEYQQGIEILNFRMLVKSHALKWKFWILKWKAWVSLQRQCNLLVFFNVHVIVPEEQNRNNNKYLLLCLREKILHLTPVFTPSNFSDNSRYYFMKAVQKKLLEFPIKNLSGALFRENSFLDIIHGFLDGDQIYFICLRFG